MLSTIPSMEPKRAYIWKAGIPLWMLKYDSSSIFTQNLHSVYGRKGCFREGNHFKPQEGPHRGRQCSCIVWEEHYSKAGVMQFSRIQAELKLILFTVCVGQCVCVFVCVCMFPSSLLFFTYWWKVCFFTKRIYNYSWKVEGFFTISIHLYPKITRFMLGGIHKRT